MWLVDWFLKLIGREPKVPEKRAIRILAHEKDDIIAHMRSITEDEQSDKDLIKAFREWVMELESSDDRMLTVLHKLRLLHSKLLTQNDPSRRDGWRQMRDESAAQVALYEKVGLDVSKTHIDALNKLLDKSSLSQAADTLIDQALQEIIAAEKIVDKLMVLTQKDTPVQNEVKELIHRVIRNHAAVEVEIKSIVKYIPGMTYTSGMSRWKELLKGKSHAEVRDEIRRVVGARV